MVVESWYNQIHIFHYFSWLLFSRIYSEYKFGQIFLRVAKFTSDGNRLDDYPFIAVWNNVLLFCLLSPNQYYSQLDIDVSVNSENKK